MPPKRGHPPGKKPKGKLPVIKHSSSEEDEYVYEQLDEDNPEWLPDHVRPRVGALSPGPPRLLKITAMGKSFGLHTLNQPSTSGTSTTSEASTNKRKRSVTPVTLNPPVSKIVVPARQHAARPGEDADVSGVVDGVWTFTPNVSHNAPRVKAKGRRNLDMDPSEHTSKNKPKHKHTVTSSESEGEHASERLTTVGNGEDGHEMNDGYDIEAMWRHNVHSRLGYKTSKHRVNIDKYYNSHASTHQPHNVHNDTSPTRHKYQSTRTHITVSPRGNHSKQRSRDRTRAHVVISPRASRKHVSRDQDGARYYQQQRRRSHSRERSHDRTRRTSRNRSWDYKCRPSSYKSANTQYKQTQRNYDTYKRSDDRPSRERSPRAPRDRRHASPAQSASSLDSHSGPTNQDTAPPPTLQQQQVNRRGVNDHIDTVSDRQARLNALLDITGIDVKAGKGKQDLYPHSCLRRGHKKTKVGLGDSEMNKYYWGVDRMTTEPDVPTDWIPHLRKHLRDLFLLAQRKEWLTCRSWSENIFTSLYNGDLSGWDDLIQIKTLQLEAMDEERDRNSTKQTHHQTNKWRPCDTTDNRDSYDKHTENPCYQWNNGACKKDGQHKFGDFMLRHICAWCANLRAKVGHHVEKNCDERRKHNAQKAAKMDKKDF